MTRISSPSSSESSWRKGPPKVPRRATGRCCRAGPDRRCRARARVRAGLIRRDALDHHLANVERSHVDDGDCVPGLGRHDHVLVDVEADLLVGRLAHLGAEGGEEVALVAVLQQRAQPVPDQHDGEQGHDEPGADRDDDLAPSERTQRGPLLARLARLAREAAPDRRGEGRRGGDVGLGDDEVAPRHRARPSGARPREAAEPGEPSEGGAAAWSSRCSPAGRGRPEAARVAMSVSPTSSMSAAAGSSVSSAAMPNSPGRSVLPSSTSLAASSGADRRVAPLAAAARRRAEAVGVAAEATRIRPVAAGREEPAAARVSEATATAPTPTGWGGGRSGRRLALLAGRVRLAAELADRLDRLFLESWCRGRNPSGRRPGPRSPRR